YAWSGVLAHILVYCIGCTVLSLLVMSSSVFAPCSSSGVVSIDGPAVLTVLILHQFFVRLHRHASARLLAFPPYRSFASRLGHRAGGFCQWRGKDDGVQSAVRTSPDLGALATPGIRTRDDASPGS